MDIRDRIHKQWVREQGAYMDDLRTLYTLINEHGTEQDRIALTNILNKGTPESTTEREVWCYLYAMNELGYTGDASVLLFSIIPYMCNFDDNRVYRMVERITAKVPFGLTTKELDKWMDEHPPTIINGTYEDWYNAHREQYIKVIKGMME